MTLLIPRKLHFIWVGSVIPEHFSKNVRKWKELNPGWELNVWTDLNRPRLYNEPLYLRAEDFVPDHAVGQFRADLLRYELLYTEGGFYADVDTVPLRPLGDVLNGLTEFAVMEDSDWIGNTYLASEEGNGIFLELNEWVWDSAHLHKGKTAAVVSGPQFLTPVWKEFGGYVEERTELWFPYSWKDVRRGAGHSVNFHPDTVAVHEWAHSRRKK